MPDENYNEVVRFTWDVGAGVDEPAQKMLDYVKKIDDGVRQIFTDSGQMGLGLHGAFNAAIQPASQLTDQLTAILSLIRQINEQPPVNPVRGGGSGDVPTPPYPNAPMRGPGGRFISQFSNERMPDANYGTYSDVRGIGGGGGGQYAENGWTDFSLNPPPPLGQVAGPSAKPRYRFTQNDWADQNILNEPTQTPRTPPRSMDDIMADVRANSVAAAQGLEEQTRQWEEWMVTQRAATASASAGRGAGGRFLPGNTYGQNLARDANGQFLSPSDWANQAQIAPPIGSVTLPPSSAGGGFLPFPSGPVGSTTYGGFAPGGAGAIPPTPPPPPPPTPPGSGMLFGPGMPPGGGGGYSYFGGGPYYNNRQAQAGLAYQQFAAETLYGAGDYPGYERQMQGPYNTARRQAMGTASRQRQFEAEYDFNRLQPPSTGSDQYYKQFYANEEVQSIGAKLESAKISGNEAEINKYGKALDDAKERANEFSKSNTSVKSSMDELGNTISRIATRVLIYSAIFEIFRIGSQTIRSLADEFLRLSDVQARVGFINGQGVATTQAQFANAAQYGVTPGQAASGLVTAAQLGSSSADREAAGQMALVFGADQYNNALKELTQTRERAASVGLTEYHNLDLLATMYKTIPGDFESYNEAIKQGIQLHGQFGTSAEAMSLAISRTSFLTETGPEQTSTLFQSLLSKLQEPATQKRLKAYGIEAGAPEDMIRDINTQVQQLQGAGRGADIQKLMEAIQGGGIGGYSRVRQMTIAFDEIGKALDDVNPKLASWNGLVSEVSDSGVVKINQLKASWDAFLLSMINTPQAVAIANAALGGLGAAKLNMDILSIPGEAKSSWNDLDTKRQQDMLARYTTATGKDAVKDTPISLIQQEANLLMGLFGGPKVKPDLTNNPEFMNWFQLQSGTSGVLSHEAQGVGPGKDAGPGKMRPFGVAGPEFGGFDTFAKGQNWDDFVASVRKYEKQIDKIPGYDLNQKQFQYYDESTGLFRSLLADSNAIRFATDESRKLLSQAFTGTFNVPSGGRIPFAALLAGFGPAGHGGGGGGGGGGGSADVRGDMIDERQRAGDAAFTNAANAITAAAQGILGYLQAHAAMVSHVQSVPTASESGVAGYIGAHQGFTSPGIGSNMPGKATPLQGWNTFAPQSQYRPNPYGIPSYFGKETGGGKGAGLASGTQLSVVNNIRVAIDGRQISYVQNRQNYRQFDSVRNSNGAPNTVVGM